MRSLKDLLQYQGCFFIDEGTALILHVIHHFRGGTVYFSRGSSNSAPGMSAGVDQHPEGSPFSQNQLFLRNR